MASPNQLGRLSPAWSAITSLVDCDFKDDGAGGQTPLLHYCRAAAGSSCVLLVRPKRPGARLPGGRRQPLRVWAWLQHHLRLRHQRAMPHRQQG
ncbi:hypothetical protein FHG87_007181 [Trinorchestia longiramus]|nr:hypothetical protein FHG87_007181 [Trinorchestia longiramus]